MFLFSKMPRLVLFDVYRGLFRGGGGVKRLRGEVDQTPPSNIEAENEWSHASGPPTLLYAQGDLSLDCKMEFNL
jgi:hypothetical protein